MSGGRFGSVRNIAPIENVGSWNAALAAHAASVSILVHLVCDYRRVAERLRSAPSTRNESTSCQPILWAKIIRRFSLDF